METGKIVTTSRGTAVERYRRITVEVSGGSTLKSGDTIEIRKVWTDEQLGVKLRDIINPSNVSGGTYTIVELARSITEDAGWPILADLILEVNGLDES